MIPGDPLLGLIVVSVCAVLFLVGLALLAHGLGVVGPTEEPDPGAPALPTSIPAPGPALRIVRNPPPYDWSKDPEGLG